MMVIQIIDGTTPPPSRDNRAENRFGTMKSSKVETPLHEYRAE
jgi:hypothetical protein